MADLKAIAARLRAVADAIEEAGPAGAVDALLPVAVLAAEWSLEARGLMSLVRSGELPARKIGRQLCVRRSDVLKVVDLKPVAPERKPSSVEESYATLLARSGK